MVLYFNLLQFTILNLSNAEKVLYTDMLEKHVLVSLQYHVKMFVSAPSLSCHVPCYQ